MAFAVVGVDVLKPQHRYCVFDYSAQDLQDVQKGFQQGRRREKTGGVPSGVR